MSSSRLRPPVRLTANHDVESFSCGEPTLDAWLKQQARKNEVGGASWTYVVADGSAVIGYYCLAAGSVVRSEAPKRLQRNMPDPLPVMVLGRLATDERYQGQGIGAALVRDAMLRILQVADMVGVRALLVHAISDGAKRFYQRADFMEFPGEPMTFCLPVETIRAAVLA